MAEDNKQPAKEQIPCEEKKLANYVSNLSPESKQASTMRSEYLPPTIYPSERKDIAKRRALVHSQVVAEMIKEIEREKTVKDPVEEYCTTYDDMFRIPGFKVPDKPVEHPELHLKHPLYRSQIVTYWTEKVGDNLKDAARLPGMTKITDNQNPFRKNGAFTTPVYARLDCPEA